MFSGVHAYTMDAKGRVSIPAPFRDHLLNDPRIVLAPFKIAGNHCLDARTSAGWQDLLKQLGELGQFGDDALKFELGYIGRAHWCDIDSAGRVLVPPMLRTYAELKKDVVFVGQVGKFRLFSDELWTKTENHIEAMPGGALSPYPGIKL